MTTTSDTGKGLTYALTAYFLWGFSPLYFNLVSAAPADEILMHRIIWSCAVLLLLVVGLRQVNTVKQIVVQPRVLLQLLLSATLLATNWGIFIWSVNNGHVLDASIGYYINPLVNIVLGLFFLQERLSRYQWVAVILATTGVLIQVVSFGSVPWIALILAGCFGVYGLIRKQMTVDSLSGLTVESWLLLPIAIGWWVWGADTATADLTTNSSSLNIFLIGTGLMTTLPLLAFVAGARRLPYSTMGFLQFIAPSMMFIQAIFWHQEDVGLARWVTLGFIWTGLAVLTWGSMVKSSAK